MPRRLSGPGDTKPSVSSEGSQNFSMEEKNRERYFRMVSRRESVKPFSVAIAHCVFVGLGKTLVLVQFFELGLARLVIDLVRKIRGKNEGFVAHNADGKRQGQLVALDSDKDASLIDVTPDVVGDRFLVAQFQKSTARIILHMAVPGPFETFDAVDEPGRARFHEAEADLGVFVEHAVE